MFSKILRIPRSTSVNRLTRQFSTDGPKKEEKLFELYVHEKPVFLASVAKKLLIGGTAVATGYTGYSYYQQNQLEIKNKVDKEIAEHKLEVRKKYVDGQKPLTKDKLQSVLKTAVDKKKAEGLILYNKHVEEVKKDIYEYDIHNWVLAAAEQGKDNFMYIPTPDQKYFDGYSEHYYTSSERCNILDTLLKDYKNHLYKEKIGVSVSYKPEFNDHGVLHKCSLQFKI